MTFQAISIFLVTSAQFFSNIQNKTTNRKRETNEKSKQYFMEILNEVHSKHLHYLTDTKLVYEYFLLMHSQ